MPPLPMYPAFSPPIRSIGWGEPGLYPSTSVHGRIATPNLDAFGRSGMVFDQAYAGYTVCAPSRTTLMTGYHSGHFAKYQLLGTSLAVSCTCLVWYHIQLPMVSFIISQSINFPFCPTSTFQTCDSWHDGIPYDAARASLLNLATFLCDR